MILALRCDPICEEPMPYAPTAEQEAILAHVVNRNARVLAGPGTGKSATLVALMDRLLAARGGIRFS